MSARAAALRLGLVAGAIVAPTALSGQTLADRVATLAAGSEARFRFAAREGVCVWMRDGATRVTTRGDDCPPGRVEVRVRVDDGRVVRLRSSVRSWDAAAPVDGTDLGAVPAVETAAWLVGLAADPRLDDRSRAEALQAAALARDARPWPAILDLARGDATPRRTRETAYQVLAIQASRALDEAAPSTRSDDEDVRRQAVFALSQRPREVAVPALLEIAADNPRARVRAAALFWLGQLHDPRALPLFERILGR